MVHWLKAARSVGGLIAIATLMSLLVLDFLRPELSLSGETIVLLLSLISALLGIDMITDRIPLRIELQEGNGD